jgi:hypothetical protein
LRTGLGGSERLQRERQPAAGQHAQREPGVRLRRRRGRVRVRQGERRGPQSGRLARPLPQGQRGPGGHARGVGGPAHGRLPRRLRRLLGLLGQLPGLRERHVQVNYCLIILKYRHYLGLVAFADNGQRGRRFYGQRRFCGHIFFLFNVHLSVDCP